MVRVGQAVWFRRGAHEGQSGDDAGLRPKVSEGSAFRQRLIGNGATPVAPTWCRYLVGAVTARIVGGVWRRARQGGGSGAITEFVLPPGRAAGLPF